jgi:hypothetical protein
VMLREKTFSDARKGFCLCFGVLNLSLIITAFKEKLSSVIDFLDLKK